MFRVSVEKGCRRVKKLKNEILWPFYLPTWSQPTSFPNYSPPRSCFIPEHFIPSHPLPLYSIPIHLTSVYSCIICWLWLFCSILSYILPFNSIWNPYILTKLTHSVYNNNFSNCPNLMLLWKKTYKHGEIGTIIRWTPNLPTMLKDPKLLSKVNIREIFSDSILNLSQTDIFISIWARDIERGEEWELTFAHYEQILLWARICFTYNISSYPHYNLKGYHLNPHFTNNWGSKFKKLGHVTQLRSAFRPSRTGHMEPMIFPELLSCVVDDMNVWYWCHKLW